MNKRQRIKPGLVIVIGLFLLLLTVTSGLAATEYIDAFSTTTSTIEPGNYNLGEGKATYSTFKTSKSGTTFTVETTITNPSTGRPISGIIELQARKTGSFLSFSQSETSCNPDHPWNVHGYIDLNPGATQTIVLTSDVKDQGNGIYDFQLVSVNRCCVDQSCESISPFGWGAKVASQVPVPVPTPEPRNVTRCSL